MAIDLTKIAPSTIGHSVYNLCAMMSYAATPETIVARLQVLHFGDIEADDIVKPIEFMVSKGWMVVMPDGRLDLVDPHRRLIRTRGREDFGHDDDGILVGGWQGWLASCVKCKPQFLEDIVKEIAA